MNNIGIIQGRLVPPIEGFQECPENWKIEFELLDQLGLSHIEWIVTDKKKETNPLFTDDLLIYKDKISSVCCDFLVTKEIFDYNFLLKNISEICKAASKNEIYSITIPLLENSNISDGFLREKIKNHMLEISSVFSEFKFNFEIESNIDVIIDFFDSVDNFAFTYDTGNLTSSGVNHSECIKKISSKISTVHLKDRTKSGKSVYPGTGETDFKKIFNELKKIPKPINYTIQTSREIDGNEIQTITSHKNFFINQYNEKHI